MTLVEQWDSVARTLPERWESVRLLLAPADRRQLSRAAGLLAALDPGIGTDGVRFTGTPGEGASLSELLERLDAEGIGGRLELVSVQKQAGGTARGARDAPPAGLAEAWERELAQLPPDWSDIHAELELASTDYLERAALLLSPLNPGRYGSAAGYRFRCAKSDGYGASPGMVRRGFERCDAEGIRGSVRVLRALSDTRLVSTQGPVWYVGGKPV
ncbi:MAG: hypothetical protein H0V40_09505 [Actinobacteria bacterium]|nr:hypothetical protein [Actinomycetota bacterium]